MSQGFLQEIVDYDSQGVMRLLYLLGRYMPRLQSRLHVMLVSFILGTRSASGSSTADVTEFRNVTYFLIFLSAYMEAITLRSHGCLFYVFIGATSQINGMGNPGLH